MLEQVKEKLNQGHWMKVRECSLCGVPLHYLSHRGNLLFQSHCGCVTYENFNEREWEEIEWYISNRMDIINDFLNTHPTNL
jgi:uncharacterized Zn finger protein (UPF0148 family)